MRHAMPFLLLAAACLAARAEDAPSADPSAEAPAGAKAEAPPAGPAPQRGEASAAGAIQPLIEKLGARYLSDRQEALDALEKMGAAAEPDLVRALDDKNFRVRLSACELLGKLKSAAAVPKLIALLEDPEGSVQEAALRALLQVGPAAYGQVMKAREQGRLSDDVLDAFQRTIQRTVEERLNACITRHPIVINGQVLGDGHSTGFYKDQFKDVVALGAPAVPVLLKLFMTDPRDYAFEYPFDREGEPEPSIQNRKLIVQRLAGEALGDMQDRSAVPELKRFLKTLGEPDEGADPDATEAKSGPYETTAFVLMRLGEPEPLRRLVKSIEKAAGVKTDAAGALQLTRPDDPQERARQLGFLDRLAMLQVRSDDLAAAERTYRKIIELARADRDAQRGAAGGGNGIELLNNPDTLLSGAQYNLACAYAQMGRKTEALAALKESVANGYNNVDWLQRDGDLEPLRGEAGYKELVSKMLKQRLQREAGRGPVELR